MKLSVIIVSWNTRELLHKCLQALQKQVTPFDWEGIVVDNASTDGSAGMVANEHPWVRLVASSDNLGFARANNVAIDSALGEYLLLLNPDTEVMPGALAALVAHADSHEMAGVVGARLLNPDTTLQPSCRQFPNATVYSYLSMKLQHIFGEFGPYLRYLMADWNHDSVRVVDQVSGACMMVRRSVVDEVGSLDEGFWIWFEEVDYCRRVWNAGWEVHFTPCAEVVHYGGQSFNQVATFRRQVIFNRSMLRYFRKHNSVAGYVALCSLNPVSLSMAWLIQMGRRLFKQTNDVRFYQTLGRGNRQRGR